MIDRIRLREMIDREEDGVFLKEAQASAGGHGVTYFEKSQTRVDEMLKLADECTVDLLVQRRLNQHEGLAAINSSSVNSLRLYSVLRPNGEVKIYSSVLRMGVGNIKVDNYASGGIACGITPDGKLRKYAYDKKGNKYQKHPTSGIVMEGYEIPSYQDAVALVKKVHPMIAHYRSVSWDVAINEEGVPVLIEGNFCRGGIDLLQLCNGPLYGDDTIDILNEVFNKNVSK